MLPAGVRHSKRLFRPCLTGKLGTETQESELKREYEKLELGCRLLLPCGHAVGAEAHCSMTESANSYQSLYLYSGGKSVHVVPCASFVLPTWPCPSTNNNEPRHRADGDRNGCIRVLLLSTTTTPATAPPIAFEPWLLPARQQPAPSNQHPKVRPAVGSRGAFAVACAVCAACRGRTGPHHHPWPLATCICANGEMMLRGNDRSRRRLQQQEEREQEEEGQQDSHCRH